MPKSVAAIRRFRWTTRAEICTWERVEWILADLKVREQNSLAPL
jgi:hypothetical protein